MAKVASGNWSTTLDLLHTLRRIFERMGRVQRQASLAAQDVARTQSFLATLGIHVAADAESVELLRSAMRTGAVFCHLATALGRVREVSGAIPRPRTVAECRRNVTLGMAALDLLPGVAVTDLSLKDLSQPTFVEVEAVVGGESGGEGGGRGGGGWLLLLL